MHLANRLQQSKRLIILIATSSSTNFKQMEYPICVDWQKAFLTCRTQRVRLADTTSDWTEMAGGVLQGTLSGPENCLNMIDDLDTDVDDVKFLDDVTLYEVCSTHRQTSFKLPWMTFRSGNRQQHEPEQQQNQRTSGLLWQGRA